MKKLYIILLILFTSLLFADTPVVSAMIINKDLCAEAGNEFELQIDLDIKETWHINSSKVLDDYSIPTKISIENTNDFVLKYVEYPQGELVPISWGENMSLYEGKISIMAIIRAKESLQEGDHDLKIKLVYQACNDFTCMSPEFITLNTQVKVAAGESSSDLYSAEDAEEKVMDLDVEKSSLSSSRSSEDGGPFKNRSLVVVLLIVFVMGLALNLTPCVYPLIPITMGYFLAQKESKSPVLLAFMYVLGLAITYSIIGTLAAFGGVMMGSLLAHPATLIFFALLMFALSLSMFGLYEFKLPSGLTQMGGGSRSGALGALIMGLTMGIVAAPCVGPFVVSLLSFVAQSGSVFIGFITFFVLALGLGLPYLFLGIFSNKISAMPRSGEWLNGIRIFFGLALIGMSIYFVLPLLPEKLSSFILPVYIIISAVYYGVIDNSGLSVKWFSRLKVILAMLALAAGILMLKPVSVESPELVWEDFSQNILGNALESDDPVIIDFYADWCNPCKELENITFADPDVQNALKDFHRLKVDLTVVNDNTNAIKDVFSIPGVPTIVFYDASGKERKDLRLNGYEKPAKFLKRLEKLKLDNP